MSLISEWFGSDQDFQRKTRLVVCIPEILQWFDFTQVIGLNDLSQNREMVTWTQHWERKYRALAIGVSCLNNKINRPFRLSPGRLCVDRIRSELRSISNYFACNCVKSDESAITRWDRVEQWLRPCAPTLKAVRLICVVLRCEQTWHTKTKQLLAPYKSYTHTPITVCSITDTRRGSRDIPDLELIVAEGRTFH